MRVAVALLLCCSWASALAAQAPPVASPALAFEVATVKLNPGASIVRFSILPGGQLIVVGVPLSVLTQRAFGRQGFEIVGMPAWASSERFDITAKGAPDVDAGTPDVMSMLRALLTERFGLRTHEVSREMPTYHLTRDRPDGALGPHLMPPTEDCGAMVPGTTGTAPPRCGGTMSANSTFTFRGRSMAKLASDLQTFVGRPVVDHTGVSGRFDVELQFALGQAVGPAAAGAAPPVHDLVSIFTAVREQLGLRLESDRDLMTVLVVDAVERPIPD